MSKYPTLEETRYVKRLLKTGMNRIKSDGDRETNADSLVYGYADRNYRIYDLAQTYSQFRDVYLQTALEVINENFSGMKFEASAASAGIYKNKTLWEIHARFNCKNYPRVKAEIKYVVVLSRESKSPEGAYILITINNYKDIVSKLRAIPVEHELDTLDTMITEALESCAVPNA